MTTKRLEFIAIDSAQLDIIQHTLGIGPSRTTDRNYFAAESQGDDFDNVEALVAIGLMVKGRDIPGGLTYYHATDEGRALVEANQPKPKRRKKGAKP